MFGQSSTAMDYLIAAIYWEWTFDEIKKCLVNSIEHSLFNDEQKKEIKENFDKLFEKFNKECKNKNE